MDKSELTIPGFPAGDGEMVTLIRAEDWSISPLGSPDRWSPALRVVVSLMLANRFPQLLWWGPDYISIYNDAYRPVLGAKHPWALGKPFREVWPEVAPILGPMIDTPFRGGPSSWTDDIQLEVNRHGFKEETHFTFAYSPVPDPAAPRGIGGVLATVSEITEKVVGERRLAALRDLGARTGEARSAEDTCARMAEALAAHSYDVSFGLVYLLDADGRRARLAGATGAAAGDEIAPELVEIESDKAAWPFADLATSPQRVVDDLERRFTRVPAGPWRDPPRAAVVVPLVAANHRVGSWLRAQAHGYGSTMAIAPSSISWQRRLPPRSATPGPMSRSVSAPKRWPKSTGSRPLFSPTLAMSCARRSR